MYNYTNAKDKLDRKRAKPLSLITFKRDRFTCQKCGKVGGTLNAHHIFNFKFYKYVRLNKYNLVTLCKSCHYKFHKIYGYKCTLAHYESYIKSKYKYRKELLESMKGFK